MCRISHEYNAKSAAVIIPLEGAITGLSSSLIIIGTSDATNNFGGDAGGDYFFRNIVGYNRPSSDNAVITN